MNGAGTRGVFLNAVRIDGGTQSRVALNEQAVEDYANVLREGGELPPITVFFDGSDYWLADGFHRFHAFRKIERASVQAEVREGTRRDAMLFSFGANDAHGLRRSNEDKRKVVREMLTDPEWSQWSDNAIAKACRVGNHLVAQVRRSLGENQVSEAPAARTFTTKHGTQATMNTAAIGKARASVPAPAEAAAPVEIAGNPAISGSPAVPRPDADDERGAASIRTPGGAQDVRAVTATAPAAAQPAQVIEPGATPAEPDDDEVDLGEQLAQMADDLERQLAENAAMAAVIEADDKLAAVFKENAKLRAEVRVLKELQAGAMHEKNRLIQTVKLRDRQIAKLERKLKEAAGSASP